MYTIFLIIRSPWLRIGDYWPLQIKYLKSDEAVLKRGVFKFDNGDKPILNMVRL
jgi:hypothetical protein